MRFFIPERLIAYEYLGRGGRNRTYEKLAKDYQNEIDFAFFVTNFNYSKADYEALTPNERAFIMKAHEDKLVGDSTLFQKAVEIAVGNVMRKKGKRPARLWHRKQQLADKALAHQHLDIINEVEKKEGKSWVDAIYAANGKKRPKTRERRE